jgi:acyl-CoA synthetase (AMP-forming)/AMP-acid ligase II
VSASSPTAGTTALFERPADPLLFAPDAVPEHLAFRTLIRDAAGKPTHRASRLVDGQFECAYGDIVAHLEAIQGHLLAQGVRPGDCVTAELSNSLCSALTLLALLDGGYSVLPTRHPALEPTALPPPVRFSRICISVRPNADASGRVPSRPDTFLEIRTNPAWSAQAPGPQPDSPRVYFRTSGSLGVSKIVVRTFSNLRLSALNMPALLHFDPGMRLALPTPIFHAFGMHLGLMFSLHSGVSIDLQDRPNALRFFEREEAFDPDTAFVVPTFCETLLRMRRRPRPYRFMLASGDATSEATRRRAEQLHGPLLNAYGSSEMSMVATATTDEPAELRTTGAGRIMPGVALRLLLPPDADDSSEPTGELQIHSPYRFEKYVDADGNLLELPGAFDGDWFRTGDLAQVVAGDLLRVIGRHDLSVNRNGVLLPFADVEARLCEIEGVVQAAVVAGLEGLRGRALVAFCVLSGNAALTAADVRARYATRAPAWSVPDSVHIVAAMPLLASGKIDRRALAGLVPPADA